jgi:hypothetical protein
MGPIYASPTKRIKCEMKMDRGVSEAHGTPTYIVAIGGEAHAGVSHAMMSTKSLSASATGHRCSLSTSLSLGPMS